MGRVSDGSLLGSVSILTNLTLITMFPIYATVLALGYNAMMC
jgi:hypothetical protein